MRHLAIAISAALAAAALALPAATPAEAGARRAAAPQGPPPFCVRRGVARNGVTALGDCRFYDFQRCAEYAAVVYGNCVANPSLPHMPVWRP
jgi:hypothetical protein